MDVIILAVHRLKLGSEILADLAHRNAQEFPDAPGQCPTPVFGRKDQMDMKIKDNVPACMEIS